MSLIFSKKLATNAANKRAMQVQWNTLQTYREAAEAGHGALMPLLDMIANNDKTFAQSELYLKVNAGRSPADAYLEFDQTTKMEQNPEGEHATLMRLMAKARSVDIGKQAFEYRKSSTAGTANSSLSGQIGVNLDHVDYSYAGTVVPIHDVGYGRRWRDVEGMKSDGFDAIVDDAAESELTLLRKMDSYLFEGDAAINIKGNVWLGIKNDPTVVQYTLNVDLSDETAAATAIRDEFRAARDVLRITNKCSKDLNVGVSQEIMSNLERPFSTADGTFGTILDYVLKLRGIGEIYEDSKLVGNEIVMYWADPQGFHSVIGMAMSTYAKPRLFHNSDYEFIKWAAVGFLAKTDYSGNKCALFGS